MKQPVIHYNNALNPAALSITLCRPALRDAATTANIGRVTCKTCLRILGKR